MLRLKADLKARGLSLAAGRFNKGASPARTTIEIMAQFSISQVARQAGLRPSAIRYYERIGVLAPASRANGQRHYDVDALQRLAVVRRAQDAGFSLSEIRSLLFGFEPSVPVSARWRALAARKISEMDAAIEKIRAMKKILERMESQCGCETPEQCGARILARNTTIGRQQRPGRRI